MQIHVQILSKSLLYSSVNAEVHESVAIVFCCPSGLSLCSCPINIL